MMYPINFTQEVKQEYKQREEGISFVAQIQGSMVSLRIHNDSREEHNWELFPLKPPSVSWLDEYTYIQ